MQIFMIRSSYIVFKPNKNLHRLIKNTMTHVNERQHILRMPTIMDSKQIQVNDFFNISKTEKKETEIGFCNLEIEFRDPDLPVFHDKPFDFFNI